MTFFENQVFHIYNQGNNRQQIFFSDENYRFFVWKMRGYLLPYGDFIAWTLMPNHFHWLFYVRKVAITRKELRAHFDKVEFQRRVQKYGDKAKAVNKESHRIANEEQFIDLQEAIGNLQSNYSKAINKERNRTGSLFRRNTKAKDGWLDEFVLEDYSSNNSRLKTGKNYGYNCLCYLHNNPKDAGLVKENIDWEFSSARDYSGLRKGKLCNIELGKQLLNFI